MNLSGTELEALELIALGRIPRCIRCPRYAALLDRHAGERDRRGALPAVPLFCNHQVCAPLAIRLSGATGARAVPPSDLPLAG